MSIKLKLKSNINLDDLVKYDGIKSLKSNLIKEYVNKLLDLFCMEYSTRNVEYIKNKYPFEKSGFKSVWENSNTTADVILVYPFSLNVPGVLSFEEFIKNQVNSNFDKKLEYFNTQKEKIKLNAEVSKQMKPEEQKLFELLNIEDSEYKLLNENQSEMDTSRQTSGENNDEFSIKIEDLKNYYLLPNGLYLVKRYNYNDFSSEKLLINKSNTLKYKLDTYSLNLSSSIVNVKIITQITNFYGFNQHDISKCLDQMQLKFPWSYFNNKGQRKVKTYIKNGFNMNDIENKDATMMNLKNYHRNLKAFKSKINTYRVRQDDRYASKDKINFNEDEESVLNLAEGLDKVYHFTTDPAFKDIVVCFCLLVYYVCFAKVFNLDSQYQHNVEKIYLKSLEVWYSVCNNMKSKKLSNAEDIGIPVMLVILRLTIKMVFEKQFDEFYEKRNYKYKSDYENYTQLFSVSYNNLLYDILDCEGIYSTIPVLLNKIPTQPLGNYSSKVMNTKTTPFLKAMIYETEALRDPIKTNARTNPTNIHERIRNISKYMTAEK